MVTVSNIFNKGGVTIWVAIVNAIKEKKGNLNKTNVKFTLFLYINNYNTNQIKRKTYNVLNV